LRGSQFWRKRGNGKKGGCPHTQPREKDATKENVPKEASAKRQKRGSTNQGRRQAWLPRQTNESSEVTRTEGHGVPSGPRFGRKEELTTGGIHGGGEILEGKKVKKRYTWS